MSAEKEGWYGFDLDGTLALYDTWRGIEHIGEPIPWMVNRLKAMLDAGHECRIFTARVFEGGGDSRDVSKVRAAIDAWCLKHVGRTLTITNVKDFGMISLYDDRVVQVVPNDGRLVQNECERWEKIAHNRELQIIRLKHELSAFKNDYYNDPR